MIGNTANSESNRSATENGAEIRVKSGDSSSRERFDTLDRNVNKVNDRSYRYYTTIITMLTEKFQRLDQRLDSMDGRFDKMNGRLDLVDSHFDSIKGHLDSVDGRLDSINGHLGSMNKRLDSVDGHLGSMNGRLDSMNGHLGSMNGRFDSINENLGSMNKCLDSVDGRLDSTNGHLGSMNERLDSVDGHIDLVDGRLDSMNGQLGSMNRNLDSVDGQLCSVDIRLGSMYENLQTTNEHIDCVKNRLDLVYGRLASVNGRLLKLETSVKCQMPARETSNAGSTMMVNECEVENDVKPQLGATSSGSISKRFSPYELSKIYSVETSLQNPKPCVFSGSSIHRTIDCNIYSTAEERRRRIEELGLCESCFSHSETVKCRYPKPRCRYCREIHNPALCDKKFK